MSNDGQRVANSQLVSQTREALAKYATWRVATLVVAMGLWGYSLVVTNPEALGELGLINALPITYFVAFGLIIASFFWELFSKRSSGPVLALHLVGLVFIIHGTAPVLFAEPRFAWAYKHFGVTEHISEVGRVSPTIDIYQNWPGFFAIGSWFEQLSGIDNLRDFAGWCQVFFNLIYLLELAFVVRTLTTNKRVLWITLIVFLCSSWVGQDYYAPQAFVYVIVLALYGLILRWLVRLEPQTGLSRIVRKIVPVRSGHTPDDLPQWDANRVQRVWAIAGTALLFFVITFSHQLTPYMMLAGLALLTLFGAMTNRIVIFLFAAIAIGYLMPHFNFVVEHYGLLSGFDPLANAKNQNVDSAQGSPGRIFVAQCARYLSFLVWGLAIVGAIRRLFYGRRELVAVLLMICPFAIMAGQSYGGEAIYRVYLFSLPWAAYLAAQAIVPRGGTKMVLRAWRTVVPVGVMAFLIMPAYFGLEKINEIHTGEVDAAEFYYAHARPGSVLLDIEPNFPSKLAHNYDEFQHPPNGDVQGTLRRSENRDPNKMTLDDFEAFLNQMGENTVAIERYVVVSKSQAAYTEMFGTLPPNTVWDLNERLKRSPRWVVYVSTPDATIYRYVPSS